MTEKRYLTVLLTGDIQDTVNNELLKGSNIARRLNELAEENKEIKIQYDNLKAQRDEFYRGARENANRVGQLEKENKELKSLCKVLITHIEKNSIAFMIDEDVRRLLE